MNEPSQPRTAPGLPECCIFTIAGIHIHAVSDPGGSLSFLFRGGTGAGSWTHGIGPEHPLFPIFCHLLYDHLRNRAGVGSEETRG